MNRDPPHGNDREENELSHRLHQKIIALCAQPETSGSTISYGRPGVGYAVTKLQRFLQEAKGRLNLPFIEDARITKISGPNAVGPWPKDEVLRVTDDPASPLNSRELFEATTSLMERVSKFNWQFNPELARAYIEDVEANTRDLTESQPW